MNELEKNLIPEENETPIESEASPVEGDPSESDAAKEEEATQAIPILEGLLFVVGDEGITTEQASQVMGITIEQCNAYFTQLMEIYSDDQHGFEVVDYGGVFKFLTKGVVHPYAERLFQTAKAQTLSQSALETLAIIAYKQPITRVEIEEIRGIGCDMMLRKLQARNLIREVGRSEAPGRPFLYEVTEDFMDSFKLLSLNELPELTNFSENEETEESDDLFEQ